MRIVPFGYDSPAAKLGNRDHQKIVNRRILRRITVGVLIFAASVTLLATLVMLVALIAREFVPGIEIDNSGNLVSDIGQAVTSAAAAICVFLGMRLLRRDRGQAYV